MRLVAVLLASCFLPLAAQTPDVAEGGVLNSASFVRGQAVTPGSLISIFGTNLAASTAAADSIPLSTSLANVSVTFNNVPAPLAFVSQTQINAQLPWNTLPAGTLTGTANIVVTRSGAASAPRAVSIAPFAPGIYRFLPSNMAVVFNAVDGIVSQPENSIQGITTRPAKRGDFLTILGSGLGVVDRPVENGRNSIDQLRTAVTQPVVLIGGLTAPVSFAGLTPQFVGVYQVNVQVSQNIGAGNAQTVQWQVGGITSPDAATIAVTN